MQQIATHVRDAGGVLHKRDLVALGATDRVLTAAVRGGHVHRARRGWYTVFEPGDPRHEAVRIGGRLTGASLLALFGAWMWATPKVTVVVPPEASRLRPRRGATILWRVDGRVPPRPRAGAGLPNEHDDEHAVGDARRSAWAVPLRTALVDAVVAAPLDEAVALLDWALASGHFSLVGLHAAFDEAPSDVRGIIEWADPRSESFIESLMRVTFARAGRRVETQVRVGPGDRRRIDLVVDGAVALELDGRSFHADTFDADRLKDMAITIRGRTALRASYAMVRDHRPLVVEAVTTALDDARRSRSRSLRRRGRVHLPGVRRSTGRRPWRVARPGDESRRDSPSSEVGRQVAATGRDGGEASAPSFASAPAPAPAPTSATVTASRADRRPASAPLGM